jgi:S1-C subfamily serine protease
MKRMVCPACEKPLLVLSGQPGKRLPCPTCKKELVLSINGIAVAVEAARQSGTRSVRPAPAMVPLTGPTREPQPSKADPSPLDAFASSPAVPEKTQRSWRFMPIMGGLGFVFASVLGVAALLVGPSRSALEPATPDSLTIVNPLESYRHGHIRRHADAGGSPPQRGESSAASKPVRGSDHSGAVKLPSSHTGSDPIQAVLRSVAVITVPREGHGSGFVASSGVLVTNYHVIEDAVIGDLQISFPDNDALVGQPLRVELIHINIPEDLAFLAINADAQPLGIKATYEHVNGQRVVAVGSPGSGGDGPTLENLTTDGRLGPELTFDDDGTRWALSMAVNGGNSGGPLVDAESGEVIGVIVAKFTETEGQSLAIPHATLVRELAKASQMSQDARAAVLSLHRQRYCLRRMARILGMTSFAFDRSIAAAVANSNDGAAGMDAAFNRCKALAAAAFAEQFADFSGTVGGEVEDLQDDPNCHPRVRRGLRKLLNDIEEQADEIRRAVPSDEIATFLGKFKGSVEGSRALVTSLAERLRVNNPEAPEDD